MVAGLRTKTRYNYVLEQLPITLPICSIPASTDLQAATTSALRSLSLPNLNPSALTSYVIWRDMFAMTGTLRTFYHKDSVVDAWRDTSEVRKPSKFEIVEGTERTVRSGEETAWIDVQMRFEIEGTPRGTGVGFLSVVPSDEEEGQWKVWLIRTVLEGLEGVASVDHMEPVNAKVEHKVQVELRNRGINGVNGHSEEEKGFDVVVVGAGQAGLGVAGRLKALGVSYVVVDKNEKVGDNWANRYTSARLHTIREYAHLPFDRTFALPYQEYLTKFDLARGYQNWVNKFDINMWMSTSFETAVRDESSGLWTVTVLRKGIEQQIRCKHVVLALGYGGQVPRMPSYPGKQEYKGTAVHSEQYIDAEKWRGKKGVIVGSANTAHDVAEDFIEAGLSSITMVQRSVTDVLPAEYFNKMAVHLYNDKIPTHIADRAMISMPGAVSRLTLGRALHAQADKEPERFDALDRAGFRCERYPDMSYALNVALGGHHLDVGASQKIADGLIKMKSDAAITGYTETGLEFSDGSRLDADIIVFCTGFEGTVRQTLEQHFGHDVASQIDNFYGLNEEAEIRGAFKPCGYPNLWMTGGALGPARYYSRHVGLQIKADLMGSPLPVYNKGRERVKQLYQSNGV